jgi:hypothetical protein
MAEEFKVRAVDYEEKSLSEREMDHQKDYEKNAEEAEGAENKVIVDDKTAEPAPIIEENKELDDNTVLSHIKNKYGRDITSMDELLKEREAQEELPEDISTFYKYKKETGRGMDDFVKLNRDIDSIPKDTLLAEYKKAMNPELDSEDIAYELEQYKFDADMDGEDDIRKAKLAEKKELAKAKEYFNSLKDQYKVPLESRVASDQIKDEEYESWKVSKAASDNLNEKAMQQSEYFAEKTSQLFSDKFEGFGFNLDENNKAVYKPADANELKVEQSNLQNFINKFLNEEGYLKDAEQFHKAIAVASDPDKFAKFFYEKGKADLATGMDREAKNIDMVRSGSPSTPNEGSKVRAVNPDSGGRLSFKKRI